MFVFMKYGYSQYLAGCIYKVSFEDYTRLIDMGAAIDCKEKYANPNSKSVEG